MEHQWIDVTMREKVMEDPPYGEVVKEKVVQIDIAGLRALVDSWMGDKWKDIEFRERMVGAATNAVAEVFAEE